MGEIFPFRLILIQNVVLFFSLTFSKDEYFLNLLKFRRISANCPDHICHLTDELKSEFLGIKVVQDAQDKAYSIE